MHKHSDQFLSSLAHAPSPCYVVDIERLRHNLALLDDVQQRSGATILLALKGFALWKVFPEIAKVLKGTCASGPHEARLGREEFGGQVHCFAPAFTEEDMAELLPIVDHLVFNSPAQWRKYREQVLNSPRKISCGLRCNPECSTGDVPLYDPCTPGSRLGTRVSQIKEGDLDGLTGLHFHTLCEQNVEPLEKTIAAFEERFGKWLQQMKWVNFGGGHHITRDDYGRDRLVELVKAFAEKWDVQVFLEPGEAIALNTGVLVTTVLDIIEDDTPIAILDTSATAHMPDVLEMPYRPNIIGGALPGEKTHTYKLGGLTCLAGDVVGEWSFDAPLQTGQRLIFLDMAHYTMVKNTTFNGVKLPSIAMHHPEKDKLEVVRRFGYEDYRDRLS